MATHRPARPVVPARCQQIRCPHPSSCPRAPCSRNVPPNLPRANMHAAAPNRPIAACHECVRRQQRRPPRPDPPREIDGAMHWRCTACGEWISAPGSFRRWNVGDYARNIAGRYSPESPTCCSGIGIASPPTAYRGRRCITSMGSGPNSFATSRTEPGRSTTTSAKTRFVPLSPGAGIGCSPIPSAAPMPARTSTRSSRPARPTQSIRISIWSPCSGCSVGRHGRRLRSLAAVASGSAGYVTTIPPSRRYSDPWSRVSFVDRIPIITLCAVSHSMPCTSSVTLGCSPLLGDGNGRKHGRTEIRVAQSGNKGRPQRYAFCYRCGVRARSEMRRFGHSTRFGGTAIGSHRDNGGGSGSGAGYGRELHGTWYERRPYSRDSDLHQQRHRFDYQWRRRHNVHFDHKHRLHDCGDD